LGKRLLRGVAEQLRRVRQRSADALIAEQLMDRRIELLPHQVPQRDIDPGQRVIGLQQVEAVGPHEASHSPHPTWGPARTRTRRRSWLPSPMSSTSGIER